MSLEDEGTMSFENNFLSMVMVQEDEEPEQT